MDLVVNVQESNHIKTETVFSFFNILKNCLDPDTKKRELKGLTFHFCVS